MLIEPPAKIRCLAAVLAAGWLTGCAAPSADNKPTMLPLAQQVAPALRALAHGQGASAVDVGQRWLLSDPGSATGHLLLAAGHHRAGDPASADLAGSGYGAARQFGGSAFWPNYLAGLAAFQRHQTDAALGHFAEASLAELDPPRGLEGVAAAAYTRGRVGLALAAAQRALALDPFRTRAGTSSANTPCASQTGVQHTGQFRVGRRDNPSGSDFTIATFRIRALR